MDTNLEKKPTMHAPVDYPIIDASHDVQCPIDELAYATLLDRIASEYSVANPDETTGLRKIGRSGIRFSRNVLHRQKPVAAGFSTIAQTLLAGELSSSAKSVGGRLALWNRAAR